MEANSADLPSIFVGSTSEMFFELFSDNNLKTLKNISDLENVTLFEGFIDAAERERRLDEQFFRRFRAVVRFATNILDDLEKMDKESKKAYSGIIQDKAGLKPNDLLRNFVFLHPAINWILPVLWEMDYKWKAQPRIYDNQSKKYKQIQKINDGLSLIIGEPNENGKSESDKSVSIFARALMSDLYKSFQEESEKTDVPFLAASFSEEVFFEKLRVTEGRIYWWELFRHLSNPSPLVEKRETLPYYSYIGSQPPYHITLIVDGLDELEKPDEIIQALANFSEHDKTCTGNMIKR